MPRLSWISVLVVVVGCTCVALSSEAETAGTSAQGVLSLVCSKGALLCVCLSLLQLPRVAYNNRSSSVWRLAPQGQRAGRFSVWGGLLAGSEMVFSLLCGHKTGAESSLGSHLLGH